MSASERFNVKKRVLIAGELQDQHNVDVPSNNLTVLIFYMISVIVVCLTAFNFYLFCWILASLSGGSSGGSELAQKLQQSAAIDLVSSWNSVRFEGRVASRQALEVSQVRARGRHLSLASRSSVQVLAPRSDKLNRKQASSQQDSSAKHLPQEQHHLNSSTLLELRARDQRIRFPSGLVVRAPEAAARHLEPALVCRPPEVDHCQIRRARRVTLSAPEGVDFGRKSVQSPLVETSRLHSATRALQVLSTDKSSFESRSGNLLLFALDGVTLFSRNSAVILDAKRIDISHVAEPTRRSAQDKHYRLCVCLAPKGWRRARDTRPTSNNDQGLVFAVKSPLSCTEFTSFCQQTNSSSGSNINNIDDDDVDDNNNINGADNRWTSKLE